MKKIDIEVVIDGQKLHRTYAVEESASEVDWNEVITDMEDTIDHVTDDMMAAFLFDAKAQMI